MNKEWYNKFRQSDAAFWIVGITVIVLIRTFIFGLYQVPTGSMEPTLLVGDGLVADKLTYWFKDPQRGDIIAFNDPAYRYSDNSIKNLYQRYFDILSGPQNVTKRVIGIPGDRIELKVENGKTALYRNGEKTPEPYVNPYPLIFTADPDVGVNRKQCYKTYDPSCAYDQQPFYRLTAQEVRRGKRMLGARAIQEPGSPLCEHDAYGRERILDNRVVVLGKNEYWVMGDNRLGSADCRSWGHPITRDLIHGKIRFRLWSFDTNYSWWSYDLLTHPFDFWTRVRWRRCLQPVW